MDVARARFVSVALLCGILSWCVGVRSQPEQIELGNVDKAWSSSHSPGGQPAGRKGLQLVAGESIQLVCRGHTDRFAWTYPGKNDADREPRASHEIELTRGRSDSEWVSTLTLLNVTYRDTGEYECACAHRSSEHAAAHTRSRAVVKIVVYLFVRDDSNLFQGRRQIHETQVLVGKTGRGAVLPCASTAPDARVQLYREAVVGGQRSLLFEWTGDSAGLERESGGGEPRTDDSARSIQYDPKMGFLLETLSLRRAGYYVCRAELGNSSQERRVFLIVVSGSPSAIVKPWINSKAGYNFSEGASITMRCLALVLKGNPISVTWMKLPDNETIRNSSDNRISIKPARIEHVCPDGLEECAFKRHVQELSPIMAAYNRVHSQLRIKSATTSDSGTYACAASTVGITEMTVQTLDIRKDDEQEVMD